MAEPRMRQRNTGQQQFSPNELEVLLTAFGDDHRPLPETVKCLDTIAVDFIIETCHEAALIASYSRRAKVKLDDFKMVLRKDPKKLGRVTELLNKEKEIKLAKKAYDFEAADLIAKEKEKDRPAKRAKTAKAAKTAKDGEEGDED